MLEQDCSANRPTVPDSAGPGAVVHCHSSGPTCWIVSGRPTLLSDLPFRVIRLSAYRYRAIRLLFFGCGSGGSVPLSSWSNASLVWTADASWSTTIVCRVSQSKCWKMSCGFCLLAATHGVNWYRALAIRFRVTHDIRRIHIYIGGHRAPNFCTI